MAQSSPLTWFPQSLRARLTLGVALISMVGLGVMVGWISWRMQKSLITTHKKTLGYIVERFPEDVKIYAEMGASDASLQAAIDNLTNSETLLWVENPQQEIAAKSMPLQTNSNQQVFFSLQNISAFPEPHRIDGRYWLICGKDFEIEGKVIGKLYVAQDITHDQTMFLQLMKSLGLATLIIIAALSIALAWYIKRALKPLQHIGQLTEAIAVDELGAAELTLASAPLEVQELTQTLEALLTRLGEAWEHQRQLVSDVSHELRTPLTIISGYLQSTLRRGHNLTEPQRDALEIAESETQRTSQLLQDLLDLARADSGNVYFNCEPVELTRFLQEVVNISRHASPRNIEYHSPEPVWINADPNRLKQIFLNLIDNALKYSPPESVVIVELNHQYKQVEISVIDYGDGIPLAQQGRIFERFFRVDEARSRSGGTGLGLAIVKVLVEGMGGKISVSSQVGVGSTFQVVFPFLNRTVSTPVVVSTSS